jgi:hypothetical protein
MVWFRVVTAAPVTLSLKILIGLLAILSAVATLALPTALLPVTIISWLASFSRVSLTSRASLATAMHAATDLLLGLSALLFVFLWRWLDYSGCIFRLKRRRWLSVDTIDPR